MNADRTSASLVLGVYASARAPPVCSRKTGRRGGTVRFISSLPSLSSWENLGSQKVLIEFLTSASLNVIGASRSGSSPGESDLYPPGALVFSGTQTATREALLLATCLLKAQEEDFTHPDVEALFDDAIRTSMSLYRTYFERCGMHGIIVAAMFLELRTWISMPYVSIPR